MATRIGNQGSNVADASSTGEDLRGMSGPERVLYTIMNIVEADRDKQQAEAIGATATGNPQVVSKVLSKHLREESANNILLDAGWAYASGDLKNAQKVKIS